MKTKNLLKPLVIAASLACAAFAHAEGLDEGIRHVLLVSVDGMHQQDLERCVANGTCPNIAQLSQHGVTYKKAYTPGLSDSVPGLAALVTGGSPYSTGLFYDDIYDRTLFPGTDTTCSTTPGVEVFLQEVAGVDNLNGGALSHLDGGGSFNPQQIPRRKVGSDCIPVYPHNFIKSNTIFEVVKQNLPEAHTAWADKHAWGTDWVNGPSGLGVDDMARTEINSIDPLSPAGSDYTQSFSGNTAVDPSYLHTQKFDNIHLQNVLNQINGMDSTGKNLAPVPTIFGTNFQTFSVAQKARNSEGGGYKDASFTPNKHVAAAITYIDNAIGKMAEELNERQLAESTLFIISAKHGQSPVEYASLHKIGDTVSSTLASAGIATNIASAQDATTGNNIQFGSVTTDDVAFIWLPDQSQRAAAVAALKKNAACPAVDPVTKTIVKGQSNPGICADKDGYVLDLSAVPHKFGNPADGRTPDIMVQPNSGVIYSKSQAKDMEHGGFAENDGHVALLVSNPSLSKKIIDSKVGTTQVAPTIIKALGLEPSLLDAVKKEGTEVLPGLY
jgi:hypothetical protein